MVKMVLGISSVVSKYFEQSGLLLWRDQMPVCNEGHDNFIAMRYEHVLLLMRNVTMINATQDGSQICFWEFFSRISEKGKSVGFG